MAPLLSRPSPPRRLGCATLLVCLSLAACKPAPEPEPESAPAPTKAAPPGDASSATPPSPADSDDLRESRAAAESSLAPQSPTQLRATATKISTLIDEARTLARRSRLSPAINKYYELLHIAPHYRPAMRELAWAEFRAGKLRSAWAHSRRALVETEADARDERAQLLYYLGRIAVLRRQPALAALHYQRSLALRPDDDSVRTHLERVELPASQLPTTPPPSDAPSLAGLPIMAEGLPDGEAVCARLMHGDVCNIASCSFSNSLAGTDASWDMLIVEDQYGLGRCYHPVIETEAGWTLFGAALHESAGEEIARTLGPVQARVVESENENASSLVFEWSEQRHARDWNTSLADAAAESPALPADEVETREGLIVCQRVDARARCSVAIPLDVRGWRDDEAHRYLATPMVRGTGLELSAVSREDPAHSGELDTGHYAWPPLEAQLLARLSG